MIAGWDIALQAACRRELRGPAAARRLSGDGGSLNTALDFVLPPELAAAAPPEARGLARDEVRLLVSVRGAERVEHAQVRDLPCYLDPGDVLVINTSGTLPAALPAQLADRQLELRVSTRLPGGLRVVELRQPVPGGSEPYYGVQAGAAVRLAGATATLHAPYLPPGQAPAAGRQRLWTATLNLPAPLPDYLAAHGRPVRYGYVAGDWPIEYYQTAYATEAGSAEMPSAGRPISADLLARLVAGGVWVAPLLLHAGLSGYDDGELPQEEYYRVSLATSRLINAARAHRGRVVAVGTTVVRALETVTDADGTVHPGEGWTGLVITPGQRLRAVNALLTGLHEPRSSHLAMLAALAEPEHLRQAYAEALAEGYLWHEFGDAHLIELRVESR